MARQFHRPARLDPEAAEQIEGSADTAVASELAHRAAQALIGGFPSEGQEELITRDGVVAAVAANGVDAVAELWADSPATTLPGTLWRLFLLREWIRRDPQLVARRYATTLDLSNDKGAKSRFEDALAQANPAPAPEELRERIDTVLAGRLEGSVAALAPLLRLAAGFLRALAAGSHPVWIEDDADELAHRVTRRDSALLATAEEFTEASRRAASGLLD
ncbi:hypothetical protein NSA19_01625 [Actinomyces bowdenii]|uniref:DNA-directed RNA polymerase subunit beta n=1 Tax=Actinomyces capricornis TaxID=2755559 RepID=A0ABN6K518_9ACTO|nr:MULTISPECIES: hypothetical protein [Actinomyces]MCR2051572.1 hypothetical protein [Actinomyces bowdenii]MDO5065127.1 hypothetical protein [Actinomyces bowdenii]BDA64675.1 hypothetical protein MANAM107_15090 [Actinomyces capricornis]